ncbi:Fe(3+) ABC transporter substrate-binding protein [Bacterioplanoides sp. SCSIO 12839]|uniref:Fe(3+) ABC transporter substrate-binding protein n=1 Tax=Bacterioplanoides sp. SCSIO 12839 TaxID=2829569 RepID=UPI0021059D37|nr:Fe(3+) ABC transporter substrate-binding protein [Bacterioplanoides sp. SCSIO 12839]UTW49763.1 Fe(3+) ABC transporter substrate-binding protein [Bacterioplanoides sp. SCSIO 12839]
MRFIRMAALLSTITAAPAMADQVNIYSFRQPFLIEPILAEFTKETGIKTKVVFSKKGLIQRLQREGELSPADLVLTSNFSKLLELKDKQLTQPYALTDTLEANVPAKFRDNENQWIALTQRVRNVYSSKERAGDQSNIRYEDLADEKFKGKVCTRSGKHPYNLGLIASMIAHHGEAETEQWLRGVKANLARKPQGNDRAQVKAIKEGLCDVSLGNSYYLGKMLKDENQIAWANAVNLNFPNQQDRGSHVNVSGAVLTRHAPNKDAAEKLLAFLTSDKAQQMYAEVNFEYPVKPGAQASELVQSWGEFKADALPLTEIANNRKAALKLVDKVGFDL